ncbi:MAG: HNH endonuclease [Enterobacterales bacterium]
MEYSDYLRYDPNTGNLYWLKDHGVVKAGQKAGAYDARGYVIIGFNRRRLKAHRVIWDVCNPNDPIQPHEQIDHINHIPGDNRIVNLRKVDSTGNHRNMSMPKDNTSGVVGVCWDANRSKWKAAIQIGGVTKSLGRFENFDDAVAARKGAEVRYNFHKNHGAINEA